MNPSNFNGVKNFFQRGISHPPRWPGYAVALGLMTAALFGRLMLGIGFGEQSGMMMLLIPIILSAYFGGVAPGLLATTIALGGTGRFLLPDAPAAAVDVTRWVSLLLAGALVSALSEALHHARRRAEASERLHAVTLASIEDAVLTCDSNGRVVFLNAAAEQMFGWAREAALGQPLRTVVRAVDERTGAEVPDLPDRVDRESGAATESGHLGVISQDGRRTPVHCSGARVRSPVTGVVLVFRDISGQRQAEEALRKQLELQNQLAKVATTVPGVICSFRLRPDGSMSFPYASRALADLYGVEPEEVANDATPILRLMNPEDAPGVHAAILESARTMTPWWQEFRARHSQKGEIWVEGHSMPEREADGSVLWHGFVRDITEHKRAREALAEEALRRRVLFEQSSDGIVVLDQTGRVFEANRRFADMLGYSPDAVAKLSLWDWDACRPRAELEDRVRSMRGLGNQVETKWLRRDGTLLDVEISSSATSWAGQNFVLCVCREISERKRAEAALRESEQRFRTLFESAAISILVHDCETGAVIQANRSAIASYGFSTLEDLQQNDFWMEPPYSGADALRLIRQTAAEGTQHVEWKSRDRHGRIFWEDVLLDSVTLDGVKRVLALSRDITDQKRAEAALQESERRFRAFFENASDAILILDEAGRMVDANRAACVQLQYPREELLQLRVSDFAHEYAGVVRQRMAHLEQAGHLIFESVHRRRDGSFVPVEINAQRFVHEGQVLVLTFSRDLTERKRAEAEMRTRMAQIQAILAHQPVALYALDREGVFTLWEGKSWTDVGLSAERVLGRSIFEVMCDQPDMLDAARRALRGETFAVEHEIQTHTFAFCHTPLRNDRNEVVGTTGVVLEVSERKRLQAQLLRAQRLESIGRLAGGVAHDLNNILSPVLIGAGLLRQIVSEPNARELVDTIERSADRGAAIIRQLLTFSRGSEGRRAPVPLQALVRDMVSIMRETFPKSIALRTRETAEPLVVVGDATQLHQVLMNLCVNSRDAMPDGGTLTIALTHAEVDEAFARMNPDARPGSYVVLSVADTGTGITPEHLESIFDPFFTTKSLGQGTGLGLSTVLGIVKSHGGFIQVNTRVGEGTEFRVLLPATTRGADREARPARDEVRHAGGELVLVVDDEEGVRGLICQTLQRAGYRAIEAEDGADGIAKFTQNENDIRVVVIDIMMPRMDAIGFYRALRGLNARVPVIAITGVGQSPKLDELKRLGVAEFLLKPFDAEALLLSLQRNLSQSELADATIASADV